MLNDEIKEVEGHSPDFKTELADKLNDLIPEVVADGKIDLKKLEEILGDDVDHEKERFGLFWPGKKKAIKSAQIPTSATLKPAPEISKNWDTTENVYIEGDNLEVLKVLQKQYHNKIKMIYIDPPYNTGKDFVYPDNYQEGLKTYLEYTGQTDENGRANSTNKESDGRFHSHWLNMMYPRLKLARNLLTDDGVIFISIDDHEQANLKKLCDEVFGEENFVSMPVRKKNKLVMKGDKTFKNIVEPSLVYAKEKQNVEFSYSKEESVDSDFSLISSGYGDKLATFTAGQLQFREHTGVVPKGKYKNLELVNDIVIENSRNSNRVDIRGEFKWSNKKIQEKLDDNAYILIKNIESMSMRIHFIGKNAKPLDFIDEKYGHTTNEAGIEDLKNLGLEKHFDYPKPIDLIKFFTNIVNRENALILDFFSGSATTAHATMQLNAEDGGNRKFIMVQLPEPTEEKSEAFKAGYKTIAEIGEERIRRAGEKIKTDFADKLKDREKPLDVGFRVYKLAPTNFKKWQGEDNRTVEEVQQSLLDMTNVVDSSSKELDILIEVLLKSGYPLTTKIKELPIDNLKLWSANNDALVAILNKSNKPTLEQLRKIAEIDGLIKLIVLDEVFNGDDELKTNLAQICKTKNIVLETA